MANHTGTSTITITRNDGTTEVLSTATDEEVMLLLSGNNGLEGDVASLQLSTQADGGAAVTVTFTRSNGQNTDQVWVG